MRKAILTLGAAAAAVLAIGGAAPALASSGSTATATPTVRTLSPLHPDTTSVSGSATQADPNRGPVWASDNLKEAIFATPVPNQPGHYNVKIAFGGSTFAGFADPRSPAEGSADPGGPLLSQGNIAGSIQYNNITSSTAPDAHSVPAVEPPNTSLSTVLSQLFDGNNGPAAATHYMMSYTPTKDSVNVTGSGDTWATGATYTQAG
jgi:hypothetical protein